MYNYINNQYDSSEESDCEPDSRDIEENISKDDIDKYMFNKNMNISLKKLFGNIKDEDIERDISNIDWCPPPFHGLNNSEPILPNYYYMNKTDPLKKINYTKFIKDDIIDLKTLNNHQLEYIRKLPATEMFEIINTYDITNKSLLIYLLELNNSYLK